MRHRATFRVLEELNDFLPAQQQHRAFDYRFNGHPAVKDAIEAIGIPHPAVGKIRINEQSATFSQQLGNHDLVEVGPSHAIPEQLRFAADVHLGKLARKLRLLGFNTLYDHQLSDRGLVALAVEQQRILLTRDRLLLYHRVLHHGYWPRSQNPEVQIREVVKRYRLRERFQPFTRCLACNEPLEAVAKSAIESRLEPKTSRYYREFFQCPGCEKIYWKGSHFMKMKRWVAGLRMEL